MKTHVIKRSAAIALLLALSSSAAMAGQTSAVINGKSYHFDSRYDWNENNYGFGLEHQFEHKSPWRTVAMVNGFRDSTDNMSYMAGAGFHRRIWETDRLSGFYIYAGLNAFIMTRDDVDGGQLFPGVLPSLSIGNERIGLNLTYLPKKAVETVTNSNIVDPTLSGILFVQFKISLNQMLP